MIKIIITNCLDNSQIKVVFELWNAEYPKNLTHKSLSDFENYLNALANQHHMLLINKNGAIKGWYFDFDRNTEKWFAMILASEIHVKGFGTMLLNEAKKRESELNGWVIDKTDYLKQNGDGYKSPVPFYLKNGFHKLPEIHLELEHLSAVKIIWKK
ncbi:MAG: GNAT family N-acetyltransferase [Flavobacteria bacterium RIFCSPLOWO2_12_FULL_35_11]|nr:MAG: GNAT family N-acetyltransferase [Flavobacteria bacterium RIFCSPLOWO2_12_FULL_35_11]